MVKATMHVLLYNPQKSAQRTKINFRSLSTFPQVIARGMAVSVGEAYNYKGHTQKKNINFDRKTSYS